MLIAFVSAALAGTGGKCPHEVEAAAAGAVAAGAAAAAEAAEAEELRGIPTAGADWPELAAFMHLVSADLDARRLDMWPAVGLRAQAVNGLCPSWKVGKNKEQVNIVRTFHVKFRKHVF